MKNLKRRNELPAFLRLAYVFDVKKILEILDRAPERFDDLTERSGCGKLAENTPLLEEKFGLKFKTVEDAYDYLRKTGFKPPGMGWDYTNFIQDDGSAIRLKDNPYKQIALTEYNPDFDSNGFKVRVPGNRLDERQYNLMKSWVKGTYIEKVLSTFKGFVTRVRVSRMEPGCVVEEHIDYNTDYSIRIHIPLRTNDKCGFYVRHDALKRKDYAHMPADGHCWFINPGYRHSAWNKGRDPRDHLVLSVSGQEDLIPDEN